MYDYYEYSKLSVGQYQKLKIDAQKDSATFWDGVAKRIDWHIPFHTICDYSFDANDFHIEWFKGGRLNACYNAVDRHAKQTPDKTALIWESDDGSEVKKFTFSELKTEVEYFTSALRHIGVSTGDNVIIYMPMIPEAVFAMLACSRIGAVHCVVFAGFSAPALADRITDSKSQFIITADHAFRGGKTVPLKENVDQAIELSNNIVKSCLVVQRSFSPDTSYNSERDVIYQELKPSLDLGNSEYQIVDAEHPLFVLYTSGSTGKPKGLLHSTGGYSVYASFTHSLSFNLKADDVFFCTADIGWVTGHSYMVYGPLMNGTTTMIFEGTPTYPDAGRLWQICQDHKVTTLYTAPTALRTLMGKGNDFVTPYDLSSLRVLGTVGEPINPEVFNWYHTVIGKEECPVVDTWWQTETGGHIITAPAFLEDAEAGVAGKPYPSIEMAILDSNGDKIIEPEVQGSLVIANSWPGQARTIYGNHQRFLETYYSQFLGYYCTGDGAYYTPNGDIKITGRIDDVLNVSGHRMGTAELESALVAHDAISEASVVGMAHDIKGEAIYAYVTLMQGFEDTENLIAELKQKMRTEIGPIATPDVIHITPDMPKTRSGKIMRRILRKIANGQTEDLGDLSTLANPEIVDQLIKKK